MSTPETETTEQAPAETPAAASSKKSAAAPEVTSEVTFECEKYPQLTVWRDGAEPLVFTEGEPRDVKHAGLVRVGYLTTPDAKEIAALDALDASYDVTRSA